MARALVLRRRPWKLKIFLELHAQIAFYLERKNQTGVSPRGGWGHIFGMGADIEMRFCAPYSEYFEVFYQTIKSKTKCAPQRMILLSSTSYVAAANKTHVVTPELVLR